MVDLRSLIMDLDGTQIAQARTNLFALEAGRRDGSEQPYPSVYKASWTPAVVRLLDMWRACGLPISERLVWALFGAGFKVEG